MVLFDSKEIAKRALARAEVLKEEKKEKNKYAKGIAIGTLLCLCVARLALPATSPEQYIQIEDGAVPLASFPLSERNAKYCVKSGPDFIIASFDGITIPANTAQMEIALLNPKCNLYYLTYEIILESTRETLYQSDMIAPSTHTEDIVLSRALEKGEYGAVMTIRTYEMEGYSEISSTNMKILIIAL